LSVVTVGTLLCTGAAARSERTASTGAWRESSDDTGREARRARLKEAAMERDKKLGRSARQDAKKTPRWNVSGSIHFSLLEDASIPPEKEAPMNFEAAGGQLWADGGARGTARVVRVHGTVLHVEAA
jgi:hypothetical protein